MPLQEKDYYLFLNLKFIQKKHYYNEEHFSISEFYSNFEMLRLA